MENINKIIGYNKYKHLKSLKHLSDEEKALVENYENKHKNSLSEEQKQKNEEYLKSLNNPEQEKNYLVTPKHLYSVFVKKFLEIEKKEFIRNDDSFKNIEPLMFYFSRDNRFLNCDNIVRSFQFGDQVKESTPSLEKGLLIIGNFGNGKTSVMRVFENIFKGMKGWAFKGYTANELVEMYECCNTPVQKEGFWSNMNKGVLYFDDVKTERMANNYGKTNLFKDVIEKRYNRRKKTLITCNFKDGLTDDIEAALLEFGEMYGSRVFDRLFEMFNIIEFKGKSFRK